MSPLRIPEGPFTIEGIMNEIKTQVMDADADPRARPRETVHALVHDGEPQTRYKAWLPWLSRHAPLATPYAIRSHRPLVGRLLLWDGLGAEARVMRVPRDPACPVCAGSEALP